MEKWSENLCCLIDVLRPGVACLLFFFRRTICVNNDLQCKNVHFISSFAEPSFSIFLLSEMANVIYEWKVSSTL